jgi:hypothetical protein
MKAKRILPIIVLITSVLGFWPEAAKATLITIEIEAVVDYVADPGSCLEGNVKPGDTIVGAYTYNSQTADSDPSIYIGMYEHYAAPCGVRLTLRGFVFQTDPDNVNFLVSVGNAGGPYSTDNYLIRSYNNLILSNGVMVEHISWQLDDPMGEALASDALPSTPPVLTDWQSNLLHIHGLRDSFHIFAEVTSVIPEPTTLVLLSLGGLVLVVGKRKKRIER